MEGAQKLAKWEKPDIGDKIFRTLPSAIQYPGNVAFRCPLITTPTTDVPTVP